MWDWEAIGKFLWSWLPLLAIIIALVGLLSNFFNLRDRWRNWRAIKNKKKFEKRLKELEFRFEKIKIIISIVRTELR